jgi:hypothetical protein
MDVGDPDGSELQAFSFHVAVFMIFRGHYAATSWRIHDGFMKSLSSGCHGFVITLRAL